MKYKVKSAMFHFVKLHAAIFPSPIRIPHRNFVLPVMLPEIETLFFPLEAVGVTRRSTQSLYHRGLNPR